MCKTFPSGTGACVPFRKLTSTMYFLKWNFFSLRQEVLHSLLNVPTLLDDSFLPIPHSRNTSDAIYWSMNQTNLEIDSFGPVKQVTLNLLGNWEWHHIPICHVFLVIWDFLCKEYWIPIANCADIPVDFIDWAGVS